jgi:prophage tail gpP-like protein
MQTEDVTILIGDLEVRAAEGFEIVSDLYSPEGSWSMPIAPGTLKVSGADLARVKIGGRLELVGTVGKLHESATHDSHALTLSGQTLAGLLKTSYITTFAAPPTTLAAADAKYTASIPYISRFSATFASEAYDANTHHHAADTGDSVFQLLSEYARNRGLIFWFKPDGTRVYGHPVTDGEPTFVLNNTNIKSRSRTLDWDNLHSQVILVSDGTEGHKTISVANDTAPIVRPFVAAFNGYSSDLKLQAQEYIRQERMKSLTLEYTVPGFLQSGKSWRVNTLVQVDDDIMGMHGTYVVVRTLKRRNRDSGSETVITLGPKLEDPFKAYQKHARHLRHKGAL